MGQTDEDIRAGGKGTRPKRTGARTVQNGSAKVLLVVGGGRSLHWGGKKKTNIRNCAKAARGNRDRRGSSV